MPFRDESFDIVFSNAVLEHIEKPGKVISEIWRVTKRGGLSYHIWHNYYSISGSHLPGPLPFRYP